MKIEKPGYSRIHCLSKVRWRVPFHRLEAGTRSADFLLGRNQAELDWLAAEQKLT